jgi:hypothetical protein
MYNLQQNGKTAVKMQRIMVSGVNEFVVSGYSRTKIKSV